MKNTVRRTLNKNLHLYHTPDQRTAVARPVSLHFAVTKVHLVTAQPAG